VNSILAALAERNPNEIVIEDHFASLTAAQLLANIEALSARLSDAGITRLGLLAGNSAAWVTVDLACLCTDVCLLPLPVFFADTQLAHSLASVGVDAILTDDPQRVIELTSTYRPVTEALQWQDLSLLCFARAPYRELPTGTQKITFTSGSTGTPRGVCLDVQQQLTVADALDLALQIKSPRHLCLLPLSTLLENIGGVYYPLLSGGTVVVLPEESTGFSGSTGLNLHRLLRVVDRHRPTSIIILPQMLVGLVAALEAGWTAPAELKFVAVGGGKVAAELIRRAVGLGLPVYEGYGLSETASVACLNYPGSERIGSVGLPLSHVQVSVVDDEVIVSGNSFLGYVGEPDSWNTGHVATGDLGELDAAGYLHLRGRRKNLMISSFGRNISPEWVESELLAFPEIEQCVVIGDGRSYCTALISPADSAINDQQLQQLFDTANAKLPDYARVLQWRRLDEPLSYTAGLYTENGRPRRAAIAARYAALIDELYAEPAATVAAGSEICSPELSGLHAPRTGL
jgi:long-chain acyl-CoA synthetase